MISVAQRSAVPVIPAARSRFTALTIVRGPRQLSGLASRLRSLGAATVHEAPSARTASLPGPAGSNDVCIIDARDVDLPEELRWLAGTGWRRVVVVATQVDEVRQAIASGARCLVLPTPTTAANDTRVIRARRSQRGMAEDLSDREIQVLQRVADGHSNRQIGDDLCLSALTVKSHLARIARKLGTGDRAEMVAISFRSGVVA